METKRLVTIICLIAGVCFQAQPQNQPVFRADTFSIIYTLIDEVDTTLVLNNAHHLQDYGTRDCLSPGAVEAQNWIKGQFESYGLDVELQDFPLYNQNPSDNVIATLTGHVYPDEYVVIGGHYDSRAGGNLAPGADDNASGTCGVLEVARILSQYEFKRTIIFCAFSAEEYGLAGSEAYVTRCAQEGMYIIGYINMDMIGYQDPSEPFHSDMIAPPEAKDLADFYKEVAGIYLPGFPIYDGELSGYDSDHTSFNNWDYPGIFPFEDDIYHSPYIHTVLDTVGLSLNSTLLATNLIQAGLATVVTIAVPYDPVGIDLMAAVRQEVSIYPNPSHDRVYFKTGSDTPVAYSLISSDGKILMSGKFSGQAVLPVTSLTPGTYIIRMAGTDFIEHKRLILQ